MLLRSLQLRRLLSFGPDSPAIELGPLNLVIGPNGSGKSNLIDAISLLQAMPRDLTAVIREGGGPHAWIWKGSGDHAAGLEAHVFDEGRVVPDLRHHLEFVEAGHRLEITREWIHEGDAPLFERERHQAPVAYGKRLRADRDLLQQSCLAWLRGEAYPELWWLAEAYGGIKIYRGWTFGRDAAPRRAQPADLPTDHLLEDSSNLALVLNGFRLEGETHNAVLESLRRLYEGIVDFHVQVVGGMVQLYLDEGSRKIPATRLSDGTLRWLSLLAVLLDPKPPRLVCIEEPELGLHPDMIPELARLLRDASERMQLVVTTHSPAVIDAFTDTPEVVLVCERPGASTEIRRLEREGLAEWLQRYSLGDLWMKGEIGGTRW